MMEDEERVKDGLEGLSVQNGAPAPLEDTVAEVKERDSVPSSSDRSKESRSHSPSASPEDRKERSDSVSTPDIGQHPKPSRKASQKMAPRPVALFDDLPDVTEESCDHFQIIPHCVYGAKALGYTEHDTLDCDCSEEWRDGMNHACGEDSDCINRVTKMECVDKKCNCGDGCQNQRFQRRQYADVSVIKTEKKGFGLRANRDLQANDFIFEYIGEVINEPTFRRRMIQYDKEGIKHFYFMSLTKHEFVDATKKGNLGRFCNHSCNPNCYVDKWVVENKLRMGIFAGRKIQAGEELVFNYNVDRYGADPQPCYCGESNCIGFIGGKTQTERATKLSDATIEALGIDDGDSWDTTIAVVAKKPRKKKAGEDDEEYVNSVQARGLDEKGVQKVMATLMQCKEKWIAVKLLERIQTCDERLLPYVMRMHGYEFLKTTLNKFKEDYNVVLQVLDILYKFPRLTRNKIDSSQIELAVRPLADSEHEDVAEVSRKLLDEWSKLAVGYRISRFAPGKATTQPSNWFEDRRGTRPEESLIKPVASVPLPDNVPKGPRSSIPQRNATLLNTQRQRRPPDPSTLPAGWFIATDKTGSWYYYTKGGATQWQKPTMPAPDAGTSKGPSKAMQEQKTLQDIIDSLTKPDSANALRTSASQTPQHISTPVQEPKKEKWRSLPIDKQMKIYENTLYPAVKYVVDKFRHKLPKEDLKKFAKDINKKLVSSDYKNKRVEDPTKISSKQEKKVKKYVKEFFDKAVTKYNAHEKKKAERVARDASSGPLGSNAAVDLSMVQDDTEVILTDDEDINSTPGSSDRKRKREDDTVSTSATPSETPSMKRLKEDEGDVPSPPPPPPPPPEVGSAVDGEMTEQEQALLAQEEALILENEEAQRAAEELRDQEAALERENELNMLDFEREQQDSKEVNDSISGGANGSLGAHGSNDGSAGGIQHSGQGRKQELMSH
ncbi:uncharacterized protein BCR38DRAFT_99314 [Pseudomassariella vexata]|uniref:Histone-lysine N-methyltransferase, H3 lysine-36 specific n=1 Tax=Pseudomassariella vexata TaxID=1141098 RepID=A0A1Y2EES3_9PEZI|nr:uncharacterized protein BCR38DRAFT_99314 [Pseudomassariella vexata]ORY70083.1 hypothetical protein BCR38DRAFT_99314 [Pseudomassariella vexata]